MQSPHMLMNDSETMTSNSVKNEAYDRYEIIIVGAGVSGMMLARLLDNSGIKTLLLERKPKIQIRPETFGTFTVAAREHKLEAYIEHYFDTFTFYGPTNKASASEKDKMCLVNYQKWIEGLEFKNVKIKTSVQLTEVKRVSGGLILRDGDRSYFGKMVVDSSGYSQIISKLLGLEIQKELFMQG